jgi:hypothetical protein
MDGALQLLTLGSAGVFAGGALFVSIVEHPARLRLEPTSALTEFRHSYQRAAPWQGFTALLALSAGVAATALGSSWQWAAGGGLVGLAVPVTLVAILPTNKRLLSQPAPGDLDALQLLRRWGRLHPHPNGCRRRRLRRRGLPSHALASGSSSKAEAVAWREDR